MNRASTAARPRLRPSASWVLLALATSGCFHAGQLARTGELARKGSVAIDGQLTFASYAPGEFVLDGGYVNEGNGGQRALVHPITYLFFHAFDSHFGLRYAALDWLEVDLQAGAQEQGLGVRFALAAERQGAPVSVAAELYGGYRPLHHTRAWTTAARVELSHRFASCTPFVNAVVSYGVERHAITLDDEAPRTVGGAEKCQEYCSGEELVTLPEELRVTLPLGVLIPASREMGVTITFAPYVTAYRRQGAFECTACSDGTPAAVTFRERFGGHLLVGFVYLSDPDERER